MRIRSATRTLAITLGSVAACQADDRQSAARSDTSAATPVVTLSATDYAFQTRDTIAAGWTTFRLTNNGGQPHMGQLIRLEPGMTLEDFLKAYGEAFRAKGPRPERARRLGGPGVATPQQTSNATVYLEPGNYVWICLFNLPDGIPHVLGHGMLKPFVVQGAAVTAGSKTPPAADVVMRLTEYTFGLSAPLTAGRRMIRVTNAGAESHEVGVFQLATGKTMDDFQAWMQNPGNAPLDSVGTLAGGVTSLAPNAEAHFEVDVTPGEYVLLCFVTAPDGRSHIEHGMIQQIKVD